jgi:PDZ domain-containing protein
VVSPSDGAAGSPTPTRARSRRIVRITGAVLGGLLVVAAIAAALIHVPYVILSPGDAAALDTHSVTVSGAPTYPHPGQVLFLTVQVSTTDPNLYRWAFASLNSSDSVEKKSDVLGCASYAADGRLNALLWTDSQDTAKAVALTRLGYPVTHIGDTVVVADVECGGPADHRLQDGDIITAVDGHPVSTAAAVRPLVVAHRPGDLIHVAVRRASQPLDVTIRAGSSGGHAFLGIVSQTLTAWRLPITVKINIPSVSGPSAGLAFTLAVLSQLTPGDVTGGHRVAATGTIEPDGSVGPVGGVVQKEIAAKRNGAIAMLVPTDEANDARAHANGLRIFSVATINDALNDLHQLGGATVPTTPPSTVPAAQ